MKKYNEIKIIKQQISLLKYALKQKNNNFIAEELRDKKNQLRSLIK
jgi:hypothetical protein